MDIEHRILTYPDFSELVGEATAEPYPVQGERRIKQHRANISALKSAIVDCDNAEAGRILRIMIEDQLNDWHGEYQAERAEYLWEQDR